MLRGEPGVLDGGIRLAGEEGAPDCAVVGGEAVDEVDKVVKLDEAVKVLVSLLHHVVNGVGRDDEAERLDRIGNLSTVEVPVAIRVQLLELVL